MTFFFDFAGIDLVDVPSAIVAAAAAGSVAITAGGSTSALMTVCNLVILLRVDGLKSHGRAIHETTLAAVGCNVTFIHDLNAQRARETHLTSWSLNTYSVTSTKASDMSATHHVWMVDYSSFEILRYIKYTYISAILTLTRSILLFLFEFNPWSYKE